MEVLKSVIAHNIETSKDGFITEGDIHQIGSDTFPFQMPLIKWGFLLHIKPHEVNRDFTFTFFITDPNGEKLPSMPVEDKVLTEMSINMKPSAMMEDGYTPNSHFISEMQGLMIPQVGVYNFTLQIDGKTVSEIPLRVVDHDQSQIMQGLELLNLLVVTEINKRGDLAFDLLGAHCQFVSEKFPFGIGGAQLFGYMRVPPVALGKTFQLTVSLQNPDGQEIGSMGVDLELGDDRDAASLIIPFNLPLPDMVFHSPGIFRFEVKVNDEIKAQIPYQVIDGRSAEETSSSEQIQ
jgi:hypothetical protein